MQAKVSIIGAGRVGRAIGILLRRAGFAIGGVVNRSIDRAREAAAAIGAGQPRIDPVTGVQGARIVFLTVPDDAITPVARKLRAAPLPGVELLIHTSGALPAQALRPRADGASTEKEPVPATPLCLSLHPIQSIAEAEQGARQLQGAYWGVEGDAAALSRGRQLVEAMGGRALLIAPGQKALYHAAACTVSNYLVSLLHMGLQFTAAAGIPRGAALPALVNLMAGTLANSQTLGVPAALTGPIERGDAATVAGHLAAMAQSGQAGATAAAPLYRRLGEYTVALARQKHGAPGAVDYRLEENLAAIAALLEGRHVDGRGKAGDHHDH